MDLGEVLWPSANNEERALVPPDRPWEGLAHLGQRLLVFWEAEAHGYDVSVEEGASLDGVFVRARRVLIGPGAVLEPTVVLVGEGIVIRAGAVLRAGAYVRGPAYVGEHAIVGHATELKNAVLMHRSQAPHFAYVGDSILGAGVNLGAGTKLSNFRLDGRDIRIRWQGERIDTHLRKLGALIGEGVQIGCNAVLNPGTILAPGCHVAPCASIRGTYTEPGLLGGEGRTGGRT